MKFFKLAFLSEKNRTKVITSLIYTTSCFIGYLYQTVSITESFFAFAVSTRMIMEAPRKVHVPAITVCYRYTDIIYLDLFNAKYNESLERPLSEDDIRRLESKIDLLDLFNFTPVADDHQNAYLKNGSFFKSCIVRSPDDYSHYDYDGTDCSKVFRVDRFAIQEYICYRIVLRPTFQTVGLEDDLGNTTVIDGDNETVLIYDFDRLSHALKFASRFYSFKISTEKEYMQEANLFVPVVHTSDGYPFMSLILARTLFRKFTPRSRVTRTQPHNLNIVLASFGLVVVEKLPSPYETHCKKTFYDRKKGSMRYYSQNECINECTILDTVNKTGKHPFTVITKEKHVRSDTEELGKLKLLSVYDLKNDSMRDALHDIEVKCIQKCHASSCKVDYSLTSVSAARGSRNKSMEFSVASPIDPFLIVSRTPKIHFNDYLLAMLSLLGFWLGASVHRMNPSHAIVKLLQKRHLLKIRPKTRKSKSQNIKRICIRNRNILQAKLHYDMSQFIIFASQKKPCYSVNTWAMGY